MIKYFCDLCGKEITGSPPYKVVIQRLPEDVTYEDVCHECLQWVFQRTRKCEQLKEQAND